MQDSFGRRINYLRVSVTDRCNLRCSYCMPEQGVSLASHDSILSFEEILDVVKIAVKQGIDKVRITGGEPLVRHNITELIAMISKVGGISDLSMTTNAVLLDKHAKNLRRAGLQRVNISLDTMDAQRFSEITRGGDIRPVLLGIETASNAGLLPIKLNCVVEQSLDEPDALQVAAYGREHGYEVRFIRQMDLSTGKFWIVEGGSGGECGCCNRLRLSSEGFIRPCLFSDLKFNIRELGPAEALKRALESKPEFGLSNKNTGFSSIGG